ncbi:YadA-like family protein [Fusobacterium necrophorum subsp. funduliforme]
MIHNLESKVKGCLKRRVSVTLAILTIFAITGSVGYAGELKENYEKGDFGILPGFTQRGKVSEAFNATNAQVNSNTVTIDVHSDELLKHDKGIADNKKAIEDEVARSTAKDAEHDEAIQEIRDVQQAEIAERVKGDLANENAIKDEVKRSTAKDAEHDEKIAANTQLIEDEIERSVEKDAEHDKGIADNKKAIEDEVARSTAEDLKHDKGIAANKKAIEDEVERSTAEDLKHDKGIAANKKAIEDEVERSTAEDLKHDKGIAANKKAIEDEVARSTAEDLKHDKGIADNKKAIEELRRDSEAGIASVAAMSVLDFKGAPVGRVGIGAAVGGYRSKQAVAVGMAYAPNENLNFTGKVGLSTDDIKNSAYGVGVNYFF